MKFHLISDGSIPVPPVMGWGALERVVWAYKIELEKAGHEVFVSNHTEDFMVLEDYRKFKPDVAHNHLGKHHIPFSMMKAQHKIFSNHGGAFRYSISFWKSILPFLQTSKAFVLSNVEESFFLANNIDTKIMPNGVFCNEISCDSQPKYNASIYLGKIMALKRQAIFQKLGLDVVYVGNQEDNNFNYSSDKYLGSWNYEQVKNNLTKFSNLVLLSQDELQPLVCLEAMSAGLGLVLSEPASQSLDKTKPWITVIPERRIQDIDYINNAISNNRQISTLMRTEIREYAKTFDWSNIIKNYLSQIIT